MVPLSVLLDVGKYGMAQTKLAHLGFNFIRLHEFEHTLKPLFEIQIHISIWGE